MQRHAEDMVSLMRPHSLGGRGAVRNGHRERSDAPVRNAQAHAWQQRTRGAAGTSPTQLHPTTVFTSCQPIHGTKFFGVVGVQSWGGLA